LSAIIHDSPKKVAGDVAESLRTFKVASWLGWQIESNWADPFAFFVFSIMRPLGASLILVLIYGAVSGNNSQPEAFTYLYVSNAWFTLVVNTIVGLSWTIIDEREFYKMLKYVYTSPARIIPFLMGRGLAKIVIGMLTFVVLMGIGIIFFPMTLSWGAVQWGWLPLYFVLGMIMLVGLGLIMAAVSLRTARHGGSIGEIVAGLLLLFCGAYYPVDVLPDWIQKISLAVPVTYWLEGMRRATAGRVLAPVVKGHPSIMSQIGDLQLLSILVFCAVASLSFSIWFYKFVERTAKEAGVIDKVSNY